MTTEPCHICKAEDDTTECKSCGEPTCADCCMPYNQFTQIDYTLCQYCGGEREEQKADMIESEEKMERERQAKREERNAKARARYASPEQVEKRKGKKLKREKAAAEFSQRVFSVLFKGIIPDEHVDAVVNAHKKKQN